jgi:hypothetical protein
MVLSMIQGIALNIGVLPFSKGRALHREEVIREELIGEVGRE